MNTRVSVIVGAGGIGQAITHLAFYAGWPAASTAVTIARRILRKTGD